LLKKISKIRETIAGV